MVRMGFGTRRAALGVLLLASVLCLCVAQGLAQSSIETRIDRIVHGLRAPVAIKNRPAVRWTLAERMAAHRVPAVSIAIIDGGRVVWAGGFGVRESGAADPVTTSTLFQAQSVSKALTTTALLRLLESGKLSLDVDVNRYLSSWKVPENSFTTLEKVTLRRIVSHSAGMTVGGFGGYREGDSIPSLVQILNGEKPANNEPIRVDVIPGTISRYSGGGFSVLQQLLIDVAGEPFPVLMNRLVLNPSGMKLSTFEQPLPASRRLEAASGHDSEGVVMRGKWPIHPEMAAAGLWTTPTDLAMWSIEISSAWNARPSTLLSKNTAAQMLTMQKAPFGLGVVLKGQRDSFSFGHTGANLGFRAEVEMFPNLGKGAVVMTNADLGGSLIDEIYLSIAAEYEWPARSQSQREAISLTSAQLDQLAGLYNVQGPFGPVTYEISRDGDRLFAELKGFGPRGELFATNPDALFSVYGHNIVITRDASGRVLKATLGGQIEAIRKQ